jgi:TonB family protein
MRLFGAKPVQPHPESQWLVPWRDSDGRFSIDFPFRVISTIDGACYGPATCRAGLLIGSVERIKVRNQAIQIVHAIPLEVDERGQLSGAARERLTACRPAPSKAVMTVGLFVSEAAGEPEAVCTIVSGSKRLFPPSMVIAVVGRNGIARLYEWKWSEDQLIAMSPELRLHPSLSAEEAAEPSAYQGAAAMVPAAAPTAAVRLRGTEGLTAVPSTPGPQTRKVPVVQAPALPDGSGVTVRFDVPRWVGIGVLVLGACMLATGIWYVRTLGRKEPAAQSPTQQYTGSEAVSDQNRMALQVARRAGDLLITWDRNLQTTIGARHGVLQITDGDEPNYLPLSVKDLTSAQVVYVPRSRNVTIQLTAFTDSTSFQETIRVIQADAPRVARTTRSVPFSPPQRAPVTVPPGPQLSTVPAEPARVTTPANAPTGANAGSEISSKETNSRENSSRETRTRSEAPVSEVVLPPPSGKAEDREPPGTLRLEPTNQPPPVSAAVQKTPEPSGEAQAVKPPQAPAVKPSQTAAVKLPQAAVPESPAANLRTQAPSVSDYKPPVATRQVTPVLANNVKRMLLRDTAISVKLRVDANGDVVSAESATGSGLTGFLGKAAEEAARSWRFRPATSGGKPLPADYTVTFIFKR